MKLNGIMCKTGGFGLRFYEKLKETAWPYIGHNGRDIKQS